MRQIKLQFLLMSRHAAKKTAKAVFAGGDSFTASGYAGPFSVPQVPTVTLSSGLNAATPPSKVPLRDRPLGVKNFDNRLPG